jgi:pilus assembly protein CpaB
VKRRFVGLVAPIVLAAVGTAALVGYVQSAHDRAGASESLSPVLVVTHTVTRGTKGSALNSSVALRRIPANLKADHAVADLRALRGKVASTDLFPGEQVVSDRFEDVATIGRLGVPKGLLEVTVKLSPERALGGAIAPGDTVAVAASFEPFDLNAAGGAIPTQQRTPNSTQLILHQVQVTNVQPAEDDEKSPETRAPKLSPKGDLLVTMAVDASAVQRIVFSAEYGALWLAAEPADAPEGAQPVETRASVYR